MQSIVVLVAVCVIGVRGWTLFNSDPRIEPHEEVTATCLHLADWGSCDFYTCLENRFPCGHDGYAIKIGKHFCNKGMTLNDQLTPEGQRYFNKSMICMTSSLKPVYESYASRCNDIKDEAVSGMLSCSQQSWDEMDFCSFIRSNANTYNQLYGLDEISRLIGLRKPSLLARLFVDGANCGAEALGERLQTLPAAFNDFMGTLTDSLGNFRNTVTNWWNSF